MIAGKLQEVTLMFSEYWRFAAERHRIFMRRLEDQLPTTNDPILSHFKFTNAFRILDRTSQYLIREVIAKGEQTPNELFFRILLFKIFNKAATWELLQDRLGEIRYSTFEYHFYDRILTEALQSGRRIYSAAYIMPSGGKNGEAKKHRSHLLLLMRMMSEEVPAKLQHTKTMKEGFDLLRSFPMLGNFLAYQFITDLNYSGLTEYTEMEFVIPGPGAMDGLKKCFPKMLPNDAVDLIRFVCDNQVSLQQALGITPITLFGRSLQLIDCQNLFCEADKYARVAFPHIVGISGRTRIKQAFRVTGPLPKPVFPRKWQITESALPRRENSVLADSLNGKSPGVQIAMYPHTSM